MLRQFRTHFATTTVRALDLMHELEASQLSQRYQFVGLSFDSEYTTMNDQYLSIVY